MNTVIDFAALPLVPLSNKGALPECGALYFVLREKEVLYVGKTKNLRARWGNHQKLAELKNLELLDIHISWILFADALLLGVTELGLIKHFEPKLNGKLHPNSLENLKLGALARRKPDRQKINLSLPMATAEKIKKLGGSKFIELLMTAYEEGRIVKPEELL